MGGCGGGTTGRIEQAAAGKSQGEIARVIQIEVARRARSTPKKRVVVPVSATAENESFTVPPVQFAVVTYEWPTSLVDPVFDPIH